MLKVIHVACVIDQVWWALKENFMLWTSRARRVVGWVFPPLVDPTFHTVLITIEPYRKWRLIHGWHNELIARSSCRHIPSPSCSEYDRLCVGQFVLQCDVDSDDRSFYMSCSSSWRIELIRPLTWLFLQRWRLMDIQLMALTSANSHALISCQMNQVCETASGRFSASKSCISQDE